MKAFKINNNSVLEFQLFQNNLAYGKTFTDTISYHRGVGKKMVCNKKPHKNYPGSGTFTLANTIRGTKNFRDGNWLGWLNEDVELNINLKENKEIHRVQIGSMENQGSGIYYPNEIEIWGALEDQSFKKLSSFQRSYAHNGHIDLKTFVFPFEKQKCST